MLKLTIKFVIIFLLILKVTYVYSEVPYFVDFKFILNNSAAGKKAQSELKTKLENGLKSLKEKEQKIQDEEKKIIQQKKLISSEEYKNKVENLRKKVSSLQNERNNLLENVSKQRTKARNELLKNLNPILSDYMKKNQIRIIIDKKSILLADENLDITNEIIEILNKKLKSVKIN